MKSKNQIAIFSTYIYLIALNSLVSSTEFKFSLRPLEAGRRPKNTIVREARQIQFPDTFQDLPASIESVLGSRKTRRPPASEKPHKIFENPSKKTAINNVLNSLYNQNRTYFPPNTSSETSRSSSGGKSLILGKFGREKNGQVSSRSQYEANNSRFIESYKKYVGDELLQSREEHGVSNEDENVDYNYEARNDFITESPNIFKSFPNLVESSFAIGNNDPQQFSLDSSRSIETSRDVDSSISQGGVHVSQNEIRHERGVFAEKAEERNTAQQFNPPLAVAKGNLVKSFSFKNKDRKRATPNIDKTFVAMIKKDNTSEFGFDIEYKNYTIGEFPSSSTAQTPSSISQENDMEHSGASLSEKDSSYSSYEVVQKFDTLSLPQQIQTNQFQSTSFNQKRDSNSGKSLEPIQDFEEHSVPKRMPPSPFQMTFINQKRNTNFANTHEPSGDQHSLPKHRQINLLRTPAFDQKPDFNSAKSQELDLPADFDEDSISKNRLPNPLQTPSGNHQKRDSISAIIHELPEDFDDHFLPKQMPNNPFVTPSSNQKRDSNSGLVAEFQRNTPMRFLTSSEMFEISQSRDNLLNNFPQTSFSCNDYPVDGYYADIEASCYVFHVCYTGRTASFACPLGTIFSNRFKVCVWEFTEECF